MIANVALVSGSKAARSAAPTGGVATSARGRDNKQIDWRGQSKKGRKKIEDYPEKARGGLKKERELSAVRRGLRAYVRQSMFAKNEWYFCC